MNSASKISVDDFSSISADQLIYSGAHDQFYRVRDLEENVWMLGRFFFNPIDPAKLDELELEISKCQSVQHPHAVAVRKRIIKGQQLALFWDYRDGVSIEERMRREFGPRKFVHFLSSTAQAIMELAAQGIRVEYLSFYDVLVDLDDEPILMPGTYSHLLKGKGDTTALVVDYEQRVLNRLGGMLLSICFGRQYDELIEACQLETDVEQLFERFRSLLDVDPGLMAIIAKCLMPIESKRYGKVDEMQEDLNNYLRGRAVTVEGIDFHQLIQSWRARKQDEA